MTADDLSAYMARARVGGTNSTLECTWCRSKVSFYNTPKYARKCIDCKSTDIYCVSCTTEGCQAIICAEHHTCWRDHVDRFPPHLRPAHRIADPFSSLFVEAVTHSERDETRLRRLHEQDRFARWFSVKIEDKNPELWLFDRFIRLCDPGRTGNRATENHYPTFVSFIGNTSVGKSTIVRAMLLLGWLKSSANASGEPGAQDVDLVRQARDGEREMPVPRSGNMQHMTDPTTFGVHLYPDEGPAASRLSSSPEVIQSPAAQAQETQAQVARFPLLLADCEGFGAGTATTNAMRLAELDEDDAAGILKLPITAPCYSNDGKDGIDLFYARILYAISDVIVFVTKNDQTIKVDLIRVLEWASAAVRKSYNQPSRKTLIIVRNMETASSESGAYTAEELEAQYLYKFGDQKLWADSSILQSFVDDYNRIVRHELKIGDNKQLYDALFQKIQCCYIPDKGSTGASPERAQQVYNHFKALRNQIEYAAAEEQSLRSRGFAKYNVPMLSHILAQVFEHFRTSEGPLDFFRAARRDNPTPRNIAQHVANFLRLALEHKDGSSSAIESMIVDAVSLMFLIYVRRRVSHIPNPSDMFDDELKTFWIEGVDSYLVNFEKCNYVFRLKNGDAVSCTVRGRYGHAMHVYSTDPGSTSSLKPLQAPGAFHLRRSWSPADQAAWLSKIKQKFLDMYHTVFAGRSETSPEDLKLILKLRQEVHRTHHSVWSHLQSNKTCLSCHQSVSDHVLPCGHSYCPRCVQEIAKPSRSYECAFDMSACILCGKHNLSSPHQIQLKPRCAGVRILTLDGGGIRGIVELAMLRALEKEVGLGVQISELFDLVVGTSTGGIIALALVMSGDSTENMVNFFKNAAKDTFGRKRARSTAATRALMILGRYDSQYSDTPLKTALSNFFREDTSLFAPAKSRLFQSTTRVAVTSARDEGETDCIIANYNRPQGNWTRFEREDDATKDMKIWEAARATSAAPFYLPPFRKQPGNSDYIDGAVYANCPAKVAIEEKDMLWPDDGTNLDILLSLGSGHQVKKKPKIPMVIKHGLFTPLLKMFERQMDTEKSWDELKRTRSSLVKERLHRLNPDIQGRKGDYVDIDDYKEVEHLLESVQKWTTSSGAADIRHISRILIANLFFFEPDQTNLPEEGKTLRGSVRCRLQHESEAVKLLLARVVGFVHATVTRAEVSALGDLVDGRWTSVRDNFGFIKPPDQMFAEEDGTKRFRLDLRLPPSYIGALYQVLAVQLVGEEDKIAISGFPATLEELNQRSKGQWLQ